MTGPFRVLAVEDDDDAIELMRLALKNLPLDIVHAPTGADAVLYLSAQVPDLVFLDLNLPDMRGWEVLDHFRDDARLSRMNVVVLTSHHEPVHRLIGRLQPIAAYLQKPVPPDRLRRHVSELLQLT